jgi:hypothetical protein
MQLCQRRFILISLLLGFSSCSFALADKAPEVAPGDESEIQAIVIEGLKNPKQISLERLYKGVEAFDEDRALAPNATLKFSVRDTGSVSAPIGLRLELSDRSIPIDVDATGAFELPILEKQDVSSAMIVANRRAGDLRFRPMVRSPETTDESRRLGDLRLECKVFWAIEKEDVPLFYRAAFGIAGGACTSSNIEMDFSVPHRLVDAVLTFDGKSGKAPITQEGLGYWPPMHDRSWPDNTLVTLHYAEDAPSEARANTP